MSDFIRQIEVLIGPLKEIEGDNDENSLRLFSDGSQDHLRISCSIQKSIISVPNVTTILVYNLSEDTRSMLTKQGTKIKVNAGYLSSPLHQVYSGSIVASYSERSGSDIVTRLMCWTLGDAISMITVSKSWVAGTSVAAIVKEIAGKIPGATVDSALIQVASSNISSGGFSYAGNAKTALDKLALQYGFSWSIQDGVFQALDDAKTIGNTTYLNGNDGTLINISPILQGPFQFRAGTKIRSLYSPITAGGMVVVESMVNKWLNREYKVHTVEIKLDTFSSDWTMDLHSMVMG